MMAELGDLQNHIDEAKKLFRETEERRKHCRERLTSLIAAVESRLIDNQDRLERNRADFAVLTRNAEQLGTMLRQLRETLGDNAVQPAATVPRTIEDVGGKPAPEAHKPDDPEKIRQGLRRALTRARAPRVATAPAAAGPGKSEG